jgi:hypothetical protein
MEYTKRCLHDFNLQGYSCPRAASLPSAATTPARPPSAASTQPDLPPSVSRPVSQPACVRTQALRGCWRLGQ